MKKLFLLPVLFLSLFTISCSDDDSQPAEETKETIATYKGVELKLDDSDKDEYGIAFSSMTGKTYKASEINEDNIAEIDLVSFNLKSFIAFDSPTENSNTKNIKGVKATKIQHTNVTMTAEEFDAIEDDSKLKDLTITNDNESVKIDYRGVILFENANGKKGVIKVNLFNADRISFDVKVMK